MSTPKKGSLSDKAMLADFRTSFWEGRKKDNGTSKKVTGDARADDDAGIWWTRIVPPRAVKKMQSALNRGRSRHKELTLPWNDSGVRILPAAMFLEYTKVMREAKTQFEAEVVVFLQEYPTIVAQARKRLGDLFKAEAFPDSQQIRRKFRWHVSILPLPSADDFRVDLGDEESDRIRKEIEEQVMSTVQTATGELWQKLYAVVERVVNRLGDPEKVFKDSLIGNVVEMVDLLPKLNLAGDTNLEQMRQAVAKKLAGLKPQELRDNENERSKAAKTASEILDQMKAFLPKE